MDDESLFSVHARFKADEDVPEGWYRDGESMAENAWVVDLDLFVEVTMPATEWEALRGQTFDLGIGEDQLSLDIPEDVNFDECWLLPRCGLFEPAPGVTEDQLADAEEFEEDDELGRFGDLFVLPMISEAP